MASYVGDYTNDLGIVYSMVLLDVFLLRSGSREDTSETFDGQYLPPSFLNVVRTNVRFCSLPSRFTRLRTARLQLGNELEFVVPCPFNSASPDFDSFLRDLWLTSTTVILFDGEQIDRGFLSLYLSRP